MYFQDEIEKWIPSSSNQKIDWAKMDDSCLGYFFPEMREIPQNPEFHGEGDVYCHTQMVCEELVQMPEFENLPKVQKTALFAAAVFHDAGKIRTTKMEEGKWVSPHHSSVGSQMLREYLWKNCGLCGTREAMTFRELICMLVRYHMLPTHLLDQEDGIRKAREVASCGELIPGFSWKLLCLLSEADIKGRIAPDTKELLEKAELSRVLAEEAGCLEEPYRFYDSYTKYAYLSGKNIAPDQPFYDPSWGEVILVCGLPGTGKDTWIKNVLLEYPMVSLDDIRMEMGIKPTENQGLVIQKAQEYAKEYLRKHQPFVWNATNITRNLRQKQIRLFQRYGAAFRIVYLETDWNTQVERNSSREAEVPLTVMEKMLGKTVPPSPEEAMQVDWICV